jgi:DNA-binding NtrC family response regulator
LLIEGGNMHRLSLIVADDDHFMREWLVTVLACFEAEVRLAANGHQLLALLSSGGPVDLVISDIRMPGSSGLHALLAARELGIRVPFLFITGYRADVEAEAERLGAVVLDKPVSARHLVATVREMCPATVEANRPPLVPAKVRP